LAKLQPKGVGMLICTLDLALMQQISACFLNKKDNLQSKWICITADSASGMPLHWLPFMGRANNS
jgi:hypothetical protein